MLTIKPHTARCLPPRLVSTDKGEALPVDYTRDGIPLACQIAPVSTEVAFRAFGVELKDAFRLLCEIKDAPALPFGTLVWWKEGALWLKVEAVQTHLASPLTQHTQVLLSKVQLRNGVPRP